MGRYEALESGWNKTVMYLQSVVAFAAAKVKESHSLGSLWECHQATGDLLGASFRLLGACPG